MHHYYFFLLAGLLVVPWLQSGVTADHATEPGVCCYEFYKKIIPFSKIEFYEETRSDCPQAGVIFITKRSLRICVKPEQDWVKKAIDRIIQRDL